MFDGEERHILLREGGIFKDLDSKEIKDLTLLLCHNNLFKAILSISIKS